MQYKFWVSASVPYIVEADNKEDATALYENGEAELDESQIKLGDLEEVESIPDEP